MIYFILYINKIKEKPELLNLHSNIEFKLNIRSKSDIDDHWLYAELICPKSSLIDPEKVFTTF